MSRKQVVFVCEVVCAVVFATGVGLVASAISGTVGVGAALLALSAIGFLFVIAWERDNAG